MGQCLAGRVRGDWVLAVPWLVLRGACTLIAFNGVEGLDGGRGGRGGWRRIASGWNCQEEAVQSEGFLDGVVVLQRWKGTNLAHHFLDVELPMRLLLGDDLRVGGCGREVNEELTERRGGEGDVVAANALCMMQL